MLINVNGKCIPLTRHVVRIVCQKISAYAMTNIWTHTTIVYIIVCMYYNEACRPDTTLKYLHNTQVLIHMFMLCLFIYV